MRASVIGLKQLWSDAGQWRHWLGEKWLTSYRLNALRTTAYGLACRCHQTRAIFILGCQRSGTTMLANVIGLSPRVKSYGEGDERYFRWQNAPLLLPLEEVATRLAAERNPHVLLKPLCDSQRAPEILDRFPSAKAVWIFRHFYDCVASHVRYYQAFHNGMEYVREMLRTDSVCWKNEHLPGSVVELCDSYARRSVNLETAYALYWLARNSLFERVRVTDQVKLISYERILGSPSDSLKNVFDFLSIPYRHKYARIVTTPVRRERSRSALPIDKEVAEKCEALYDRLRRHELCVPTPSGPAKEMESLAARAGT